MKRLDPRLYQIAIVGGLLAWGAFLRDFTIRPEQVILTFVAGLLTQGFFIRRLGLKQVNYLSAVITCFGLSLLLRADNLWAHPLAATLAMSAKFLVRVRGKHVFNPANLGVMLGLILFPGSWVSPGQWGQDIAVAGWFVVLGTLVVTRARRMDVSWMFLTAHMGLLGLRVLWLGHHPGVWWHALQNGSLLLFTFFMISDPMTIPNHPRGRLVYATLVAAFAYVWQFHLYNNNGPLWALFLLAPLVPFIDVLWPSSKYVWSSKGGNNEKDPVPEPVRTRNRYRSDPGNRTVARLGA